ncbi:MAG: hypothetical protein H6Q89_2800 [Myxococcaceae bacterium]|nr:hypothetical protein [Myxococcaceae bacterium]
MIALYNAHSGLRYLVLLAGVVSLAICILGLVQKKAFSKPARISGSVFLGTLHLQVLVGLALVAMRDWYPAMIGHIVTMVVAAVLAQVLITRNKKSATPGYRLPVIAIGTALVLIALGIYAIGRTPLMSTRAFLLPG